MLVLSTQGWTDYELIDSGNGQRLERFGKYRLVRPDPQIIWKPRLSDNEWKNVDAVYEKTAKSTGKWTIKTQVPDKWQITYKDIALYCKLSSFKHTGIFPEQSLQWDWMTERISQQQCSVLNLFGYTGIASLVAAVAGAKVTHVDASFPTIGWARENQAVSKLNDKPIRWILDDALSFVRREIKRGNRYDGIIMDPPIYGHGPKGEVWDFNTSFPELMEACKAVLSEKPLFMIVNAYAISSSSLMLENVLKDYLPNGTIESGELALQESNNGRLLSTGIFARWSA